MNTLQFIKEQIKKKQKLHNARLAHTATAGTKLRYRGVAYTK